MARFSQVLVGNILINPEVLRSVLKKTHYYARYEQDKDLLIFAVTDDGGGEMVFQIRNISYESARKLAEGLGLRATVNQEEECCWAKWNPVYKLFHDGSLEAEEIRMEALRLELPLRVKKIAPDKAWLFYDEVSQYSGTRAKDRVIEILREQAERYAGNLSTTP